MANVTYDVEVRFFSTGNPGQALGGLTAGAKRHTDNWLKDAANGMANILGSANSAFDSLASTLVSGLTSAAVAGTAALTAGLVKATSVGVQFNDEIEQATIGLAAIFQANGSSVNMGAGMTKAREMIGEMRKDARELPGEFKDLVNIMSTIATPGGKAGKTPEEIEKMAAMAMAGAAVLHVPQATAAREMAMLLEGNAKHNQPLALRLGVGDLKEFNVLNAEQRFDRVKESLDKLNPAIKEYARSWMGIKTTAVDSIRAGLGVVVDPLMRRMKSEMYDFLNPSEEAAPRRAERFQAWGKKASEELVAGFIHAENFLRRWVPIADTFVHTLQHGFARTFGRLEPIMAAVGQKLEKFMKDPQAFDKLASMAQFAIAGRVGSGALQAGMSGLGGLAEVAGGGNAMAGLGLLLAPEVILPIAAGIAALGVAAFGAVQALTDSQGIMHEQATIMSANIAQNVKDMGKDSSRLAEAAKPVTEFFGLFLIGYVENMSAIYGTILEFMADFAVNSRKVIESILVSLNKMGIIDYNPASPSPHNDPIKPHMDYERNDREGEDRRKTPETHNHTTNIGKIEIKVEGNEDPDRVAQVVFDRLNTAIKNPKTSPMDPRVPILEGRTDI